MKNTQKSRRSILLPDESFKKLKMLALKYNITHGDVVEVLLDSLLEDAIAITLFKNKGMARMKVEGLGNSASTIIDTLEHLTPAQLAEIQFRTSKMLHSPVAKLKK